jgi:hypothetical protein
MTGQRVPGGLLAIAFGVLAFLTRSRHPTFDAWHYSLQVETAIRLGPGLSDPDLWHPHHLAYVPLGYLLVDACRLVFGSVPALIVLQGLSAVCASGCLWALMRILDGTAVGASARSTPAPNALACLPLAFAFTFWYFAGEAEVYLPALCFATLGMVTLLHPTRHGYWIPLPALLLLAATLMHQMMVLLALPLACWWAARALPWRTGVPILLLWGFGALIAYGLVWWLLVQPDSHNPTDFAAWITHYAHSSMRERQGWGHVDWGTPLRAVIGLARSVYGGHAMLALHPPVLETLRSLVPGAFVLHELRIMETTPRFVAWLAVLCAVASSGLWGTGLIGALRSRAHQAAHQDGTRIGLLAGLWIAVFVPFVLWWEADNPEFWLLALPGVVLLLAIRTRGRWSRSAFSLGLVTLAAAVGIGSIAPKVLGPGAEELAMFARVAGSPTAREGGRIWPGFASVFLPVQSPLWERMAAPGALDSLESDARQGRERVWILPDSVAVPRIAGAAVRVDHGGSWSAWSVAPDGNADGDPVGRMAR